uniref:Uncharacterized protein n=1 Tax=Chelydra serpentina TaxID=8475 RepID=A0A8C3SIE1_CHESE
MSDSLPPVQLLTELLLQQGPDAVFGKAFLEIRDLARRFSLFFSLHQLHNRQALVALHKAGIKFALQEPAPSGSELGPLNLPFLEVLSEFSPRLLHPDKKLLVDKCKVMHIKKHNPNYTYKMKESKLAVTTQEGDLGVIVDSCLKTSTQCAAAGKKANRMLGIIRKGIDNKTENILLPLYKSMVRPHLEYCVQMWSPHCKKDLLELEKVQKRATKMMRGVERLPYEERFIRLGLFSLEKRRLRGDMTEVYKIMTGAEKVNQEVLFTPSPNTRTRGHQMK